MFSSSQFDSSAFSGGGFMSTRANDSSPAPSKKGNFFPVTVKQIHEADSSDEKSNFAINGVHLTSVTLVGRLFQKVERNTDVHFLLYDGTGRIKCRRWINESFDTKEMEEVSNGMYVRVNGHLKSFQGVWQLVAFSVSPVTNFDEISSHFMGCFNNFLLTKIKMEGIPSDSSLTTPVKNASDVSQPPTLTQANDSSPAPSQKCNLFPVTVKQISEVDSGDEKSNFAINGVHLTSVTLVGRLFEKVERNTDVHFLLYDGTGQIKCRRINESFDTKEMEEVSNGMYVRVNGHLKSFQGVWQLVAFSVSPLTNFDEISSHFIGCMYSFVLTEKMKGIPSDSSLTTPVKNASNGSQPPSLTPGYAQSSLDGLQNCGNLVIEYLQQHSDMSNEWGIHVNELARELKLPTDQIMSSLKDLGDEGLVYSTKNYFYKPA